MKKGKVIQMCACHPLKKYKYYIVGKVRSQESTHPSYGPGLGVDDARAVARPAAD